MGPLYSYYVLYLYTVVVGVFIFSLMILSLNLLYYK